MNGFIRGFRQLFFITALFVLSTMIFSSCSVFRTLGLYNVPPPYSESYEEYHGKPLLHFNEAENISIHLSSDKKSYYPGEPITLIYKVQNLSNTDTIGVNSPFYSRPPHLSIKNSSGQKVSYSGVRATGCPYTIGDGYGRKLNVVYHSLIPPNSEIKFTRRIDRNYYNNIENILGNSAKGEILERAYRINVNELAPDVYSLICYVNHTEIDEIKGPQNLGLHSDTLEIEIIKPTDTQINQRKEYIQIMKGIMKLDSLDNIFMRGKTYANNYPDGFYLDKIKRIVLDKENLSYLLGYIKKYKEKGAQ